MNTILQKFECISAIETLIKILKDDVYYSFTPQDAQCFLSCIGQISSFLEVLYDNKFSEYIEQKSNYDKISTLIKTIDIMGNKLTMNNTLSKHYDKEHNTGSHSSDYNITDTHFINSNLANTKYIKKQTCKVSSLNKKPTMVGASDIDYSKLHHSDIFQKTSDNKETNDKNSDWNNKVVVVKSFTDKGKTYICDSVNQTCTCLAFSYYPNKPCKHLMSINSQQM